MHREFLRATAGTAAIGAAVMFSPAAAQAATAQPALYSHGVACSASALADAVSSAYPGETLQLSPACVYRLDASLTVDKKLTIVGAGATLERASDSSSFSLIDEGDGGDLTVLYTNFRDGGGTGDSYGGAIEDDYGHLDVHASNFEDNISDEYGGAIYVYDAHADVSNSTFTGNTSGDEYGGAIYNDSSHLKVTGSTFADNNSSEGGAIYNYGELSLGEDTFRHNAADYGAAVYNYTSMWAHDSTIKHNSAVDEGGGLYNDHCADAWFYGSQITGNHAGGTGGGIYDDNDPMRVALHHTEVAGNTPDDVVNNNSATSCDG